MPARLNKLTKALRKRGIAVETPNRSSHYKAVGPSGKTYPIPAHNGPKTEISDVYVKGVCRAFGIDEAEFRADL